MNDSATPVTEADNEDDAAAAPAPRVALVTGSARRIGAEIVRHLHADGWNVAIHYRNSSDEADALAEALNAEREHSAVTLCADLADEMAIKPLASRAKDAWERLDLLVNNASTYFPTPVGEINADGLNDLLASNLTGPLLLTQACVPALKETRGSVVNIVDTNAQHPKPDHAAYCAAKAGLAMAMRVLALDLAPEIRVNGVSPGPILWADGDEQDPAHQSDILDRVPLGRTGEPEDIAAAVAFLAGPSARYITGQIIAVDGGKLLS